MKLMFYLLATSKFSISHFTYEIIYVRRRRWYMIGGAFFEGGDERGGIKERAVLINTEIS